MPINKTDYLSEFRKSRFIDQTADLSSIQVAIESVMEANNIVSSYLWSITPKTDAQHFELLTYRNLIGRLFEQVEGVLATIAVHSPTSSEALGRVVIEGSINLMYLSQFGNEKTLLAFFNSWINEHNRKLKEWRETVEHKSYRDRVLPMIDTRQSIMPLYEKYVQQGIKQFNITTKELKEEWPKSLFKRFEQLNKVEEYYTSYHRLSGTNHQTAEDTLTWLISLDFEDEVRQKLGDEAWAYSVMMSRVACVFFINALIDSCIHFELDTNSSEITRLLELKSNIERTIFDISEAAGAPLR